MLNIVTNSELRYNQGKESVDMCEAIKGIRDDAKAEGKAEGLAEGLAEGREKERSEIIEKLRRSGMTEEQVEQIKQIINS